MSLPERSLSLDKMKTIGSSYLQTLTSSADLAGGLQVEVRKVVDRTGNLKIEPHDDLAGYDAYVAEAKRGIIEYARHHSIDLSQYDVTLSRFLIHDVDSRADLYFDTAQISFDAAMKARDRKSFVVGDAKRFG